MIRWKLWLYQWVQTANPVFLLWVCTTGQTCNWSGHYMEKCRVRSDGCDCNTSLLCYFWNVWVLWVLFKSLRPVEVSAYCNLVMSAVLWIGIVALGQEMWELLLLYLVSGVGHDTQSALPVGRQHQGVTVSLTGYWNAEPGDCYIQWWHCHCSSWHSGACCGLMHQTPHRCWSDNKFLGMFLSAVLSILYSVCLVSGSMESLFLCHLWWAKWLWAGFIIPKFLMVKMVVNIETIVL